DRALVHPYEAGYIAALHLAQGKPRHPPFEAASAARLAHPRSPRHPPHRSPRFEAAEAEVAWAYAAHRHAAEAAMSASRAEAEGHALPRQTEEAQVVQGPRPSSRIALMSDEAVEQAALLPLPHIPLEREVAGAVEVAKPSLPSPPLQTVTAKPHGAAVGSIDVLEEVELPLFQALAKATLAEAGSNVVQVAALAPLLLPLPPHPAAVAKAPVSQAAAASSSPPAARAIDPPAPMRGPPPPTLDPLPA
ncbi:hypothetical protein K525DRAFT_187224, partial [Schizophyllum commune Loenen D]